MQEIIINFSDIAAGWMEMTIWDNEQEIYRQMRISYLQDFFDDLLQMCKFIQSDILGTYELYIDQEGFEANIRIYKYNNDGNIIVEINEDAFEDEVPYNSNDGEKWDNFWKTIETTTLTYHKVNARNFIKQIVSLIEANKKDYNEGFVLSPSNRLNEKLLAEVTNNTQRGEDNEKISNT